MSVEDPGTEGSITTTSLSTTFDIANMIANVKAAVYYNNDSVKWPLILHEFASLRFTVATKCLKKWQSFENARLLYNCPTC